MQPDTYNEAEEELQSITTRKAGVGIIHAQPQSEPGSESCIDKPFPYLTLEDLGLLAGPEGIDFFSKAKDGNPVSDLKALKYTDYVASDEGPESDFLGPLYASGDSTMARPSLLGAVSLVPFVQDPTIATPDEAASAITIAAVALQTMKPYNYWSSMNENMPDADQKPETEDGPTDEWRRRVAHNLIILSMAAQLSGHHVVDHRIRESGQQLRSHGVKPVVSWTDANNDTGYTAAVELGQHRGKILWHHDEEEDPRTTFLTPDGSAPATSRFDLGRNPGWLAASTEISTAG